MGKEKRRTCHLHHKFPVFRVWFSLPPSCRTWSWTLQGYSSQSRISCPVVFIILRVPGKVPKRTQVLLNTKLLSGFWIVPDNLKRSGQHNVFSRRFWEETHANVINLRHVCDLVVAGIIYVVLETVDVLCLCVLVLWSWDATDAALR